MFLSSVFFFFLSFRPTPSPELSLRTFRCGDEIMEINDTVVYNMALNDVYTVLSQCTPGPVHIIISRHPDPKVCSASASFPFTSADLWAYRGKASAGSVLMLPHGFNCVLAWTPSGSVQTLNRLDWDSSWPVYKCVCLKRLECRFRSIKHQEWTWPLCPQWYLQPWNSPVSCNSRNHI